MRSRCGLLGILFVVAATCAAACNHAPPPRPKVKDSKTAEPLAATGGTSESALPSVEGKEEKLAAQPGAPSGEKPLAAVALADELPAEVYEPVVALSEAQGKASLVKVGDVFPKLVLQNVAGQEVSLPSLWGEKLTVVVFWSHDWIYAREQFQRLGAEVAARYAHLGLKAVAINVGDAPALAKTLAQEADVRFPCLVDPEKKAFAQVAESGLPRIYLLDGQGKVLWLDLEYSSFSRRELHNAVHYFSPEKAGAKVD